MECRFCSVVRGAEKAFKLGESTHCIAVLDIHPKAVGHSLVITKKHYKKITEMPGEELHDAIDLACRLEEAILSALHCGGIELRQNYYPFIPENEYRLDHVHFHLVPREKNDALWRNPSTRLKPTEHELEETAEKIRRALKQKQFKLNQTPSDTASQTKLI
ncbi:MAG: HIT family protein [Candidatus Micrarchaeia archaeon]|jgi:histidine triad (HIT) family protein